jgi:hypothetical protein
MAAQRAEPARLRLPPVVDHHLVHHVEQVEFHRADGAVGDDEGARPDRGGPQQRRGFGQPRRLDQDVRAVEDVLRGVGHADRSPGDRGELPGERLPGFRPAAGDPDLVQVEQLVQQHDVPERGSARSHVAEHPRVRPGQVAGAHGGHRAGPAGGDQGGVHDRQRNPRAGVVEGQQPELAGQPGGVVGHEVADHLDAGDPGDPAAKHVEVTGAVVVRDQVHPRLDHHVPVAVRAHGALHGVDDLGVREPERVDVRPGEEPDPQSSRRGHVSDHLA